jgi:hypothetical protein
VVEGGSVPAAPFYVLAWPERPPDATVTMDAGAVWFHLQAEPPFDVPDQRVSIRTSARPSGVHSGRAGVFAISWTV